MRWLVERGRLPLLDVLQAPVGELHVAERVEDPNRSGRGDHGGQQDTDGRDGQRPLRLAHGRPTDDGEEAVDGDHAQANDVDPVQVGPQHEERDQQQRAPWLVRLELQQEPDQERQQQPRDGLRPQRHVRRDDQADEHGRQRERPQADALARQHQALADDDGRRKESEDEERTGAADTADQPVHQQLGQPLVRRPWLADPGEGERVGARHPTVLGDPLARGDVPEEVGILHALGDGDAHQHPGQRQGEDPERGRQPRQACGGPIGGALFDSLLAGSRGRGGGHRPRV